MPAPGQLANPFPGLRPFRSEEDYLFFGREEQVSELLNRLSDHRFVAVVGTSGSGKSSLVRCGLLSELQGGRLVKAGSDWEFAVMQPGGDPVAHLAEALLEAGLYEEDDLDTIPRIQATLRRSRFGLVEAIKQSLLESGTNLLLVVDQFEEIFRFHEAAREGREEAPDFIRLLLEAAAHPDVPIYIVLTMRSDFLGDCSRFTGLAEAVNDGEYLIPRLTRDQSQSAIEGPVRVAGGAIARRLVQRLLNDLEEDTDQLPVLQHCLMRMWDRWRQDHQPDEPIDLRHYTDIGGMDEALSRHADEVLQSLPTEGLRQLAGRVFQALTEKGLDGRGIRRPKRMHELAAVTGANPEDIETVVNAYRQPGVTFLMPPPEIQLQRATVVDISHESLMRVWTRLRNWVEEEEQSAGIYRRLRETAGLWKQGQAGLYHDPDLAIALGWKETAQPSAAWAGQYGGGFEESMAFLNASQEAAEAAAKAKEQARQRELEQARALAEIEQRAARRLKVLVAGLTVVALLAGAAWYSALQARKEAVANAELASLNEQQAKKSEEQAKQAQEEATQAAAMLQETLVKNDFKIATQRSRDGLASEELAYLSRSMQVDPSFWQAGVRALSTLASGRFPGTDPVTFSQDKVITSFEFNPQEDLLYTSDAGNQNPDPPERLVWDVQTGQRLYAFAEGKKENIFVRWTADGQRLVLFLADEKMIQVLEARSGKEITRVTEKGLRPELPKLNKNTEQGRRIVVRDDDRNVRVFDLDSGQPVTPPLQLTNNPSLRSFGFTANGQWVYLDAQDGRMQFWEAESGEPVTRITMGSHRFNQSWRTPSADFVLARATDNHRINWWHVVKGETPREEPWIEFAEKVEDVHFLPGEPRVAVRLNGTNAPSGGAVRQKAVIFDLNTRQEVARIELGPASGVRLPDKNEQTELIEFPLIAAMEDNRVTVWDLGTGQPISKMVSGDLLESLRFSPEGRRLATWSASHAIMVWDIFEGNAKWDEPIQLQGVRQYWKFSPEGEKLLTADSKSHKFQVWDARSGQLLFEPVTVGFLQSMEFPSRGDQMLLYESMSTQAGDFIRQTEGKFMRLDMPYRPLIAEPLLDGRADWGAAVWYTADGQRIVVHGRNNPGEPWQILVLDAASHRVLQSIPLPQDVQGIGVQYFTDKRSALSPQGELLMLPCMDRKVRIWNLQTGQLAQTLTLQELAYGAAWNPDGSLVAVSGMGWVQVWDAASGRPLFDPVKQGDQFVYAPLFSPDGKWLATGSRDLNFRLIDARVGTNRFAPVRLEGFVGFYDFSPDGAHIAVSPFAPVTDILDAATGDVVRKLSHDDACRAVMFSPDSNLLAVGTGAQLEKPVGDVYLWDWRSGALALPPIHARGPVAHLWFSADGALLVSGTVQEGAGAVQVWDVASGEALTGRAVGDSDVTMFSLNPQDNQVAASYRSGQVRLIDLPPRSAPLPAWLPELAQGVGGKRLTSGLGGMAEVLRDTLKAVETSLANGGTTSSPTANAEPGANDSPKPESKTDSPNPYAAWGQWMLSEEETRTLSPRSRMTFPDYVARLRRSENRDDLHELLKLFPNDALVHARMGLVLHRDMSTSLTNQPVEQRRLWERSALWYSHRAVTLEPANPEVWSLRAELLQNAGQLTEAGQAALKVLELDPSRGDSKNPNAWYFKAMRLAEQGHWKEADAAFDQALTLADPSTSSTSDRSMLVELLNYFQPILAPAGFQNLKLPEPIPGTYEDFDATPEGSLPSGWQASHQSDSEHSTNHVHDLNNLRSDAFQNWITLSWERSLDLHPPLRGIGNGLQFSGAYLQVNGVRPHPFIQGHFLHAQSQGRRGNQVQYVVTPDYDCSGKSEVYAVFHSAYRQDTNSLAGIEYSIDGGEHWLPARYMIEDADLVRTAEGAIDAQATLTKRHSNVPWWIDSSGNLQGATYGNLILAEGDLGPFFEGRIREEANLYKRVEIVRLLRADGQKRVRVRFLHAGINSESWSIDHWGLYELTAGQGNVASSDSQHISVIHDPSRFTGVAAQLLLHKPVRENADHSLNLDDFLGLLERIPSVAPSPNSPGKADDKVTQFHARLLLNRARTLAPLDPRTSLLWAVVAAETGNFGEAWDTARSVIERQPGNRLWVPAFLQLYTLQGDAFRQSGETNAAILCYETAYALGKELLRQALPPLQDRFEAMGLQQKNTTLKTRGSLWKYFDEGRLPDPSWPSPEYDDRSWSQGNARLGFSDNAVTEVASGPSNDRFSAIYFRSEFKLDPDQRPSGLHLSVTRDDGVVIYLNGNEILRDNMPAGPVRYETLALESVGGRDETNFFSFDLPAQFIRPDRNVLAAEVHQIDNRSTDLGFDLELTSPGAFKSPMSDAQSWALEETLKMRPEIRGVLWLSRVREHRKKGAWEKAGEGLEQIESLTPKHPSVLFEKALLLSQQGKDDEAYLIYLQSLQTAAALKRQPRASLDLALADDLKVFESVDDPTAAFFAYIAGRYGAGADQAKQTQRKWLLRRSLELSSDDPEAALARTEAALEANELEMALAQVETALRTGPPSASAPPLERRLYREWLWLKEQILNAQKKTREANSIRALIQAFPARPPSLSPKLLDLTSYYNVSLYDGRGWRNDGRDDRMPYLAETLSSPGGVPYDVRGLIQVNSGIYEGDGVSRSDRGRTFSELANKDYPDRVDGIRVDQLAGVIHFLTACRTSRGTNFGVVASIAIHYEDGSQSTVDLTYRNTIGDWDEGPGFEINLDHVAWRGRNPRPNDLPDQIIWHLAWKNPEPNRKISHLDFISGQKSTAPFLIAMTVE